MIIIHVYSLKIDYSNVGVEKHLYLVKRTFFLNFKKKTLIVWIWSRNVMDNKIF
jgi:hypothetical protein